MPKFCAALNCSNRANRENREIVKSFQRKLETFDSEKGKDVSSNFQEKFN